jgi:hypothetical protein
MIMFLSSALFPVTSFAQNETNLLGMLKAREFEKLESATKQIQSKFEKGALTDIELRNIYRQFYDLNNETLNNIQEWKRKFPSSYAAHLIRGTYFKRKGFDARGEKYISETPIENLENMREYHDISRTELTISLKLTKKPFLSVFHLLEISQAEGDEKTSLELLESANKMLPGNTLARNRYMRSLEPRWGGSYAQMKEFIAKSKAEGVSAVGIMQLEAIMYDDIGFTSIKSGKKQVATEYFLKALELAQRVGGEFRKDFLMNSNYYSCREPALKKYCCQ